MKLEHLIKVCRDLIASEEWVVPNGHVLLLLLNAAEKEIENRNRYLTKIDPGPIPTNEEMTELWSLKKALFIIAKGELDSNE